MSIDARQWERPPKSAILSLYRRTGLSRRELAACMGITAQSLNCWARASSEAKIGYANYMLLMRIVENAQTHLEKREQQHD